ncbi:PRC-barrel domain-containing protein [Streptacidiphilus carbonis]|uniref:PRC-barrel domain-containing protein n=1 Tax=Streptacidiphilus carbonis TaxID=105422 RepID=UPI00069366AB|nr:PRC-barrel domain-containing protein [Streptacidiphilus carbonis]
MTEAQATVKYAIGTEVHCANGTCGRLDRVVVDPVARTLTHLVVDPGSGTRRLVPLDLVESPVQGRGHDAGVIVLRCDTAAFEALEPAEETEFLSGYDDDRFGYGTEQLIAWPYFGLGVSGTGGIAGAPGILPTGVGEPREQTYERVPSGEVQIRRGERVEANDGEIGRVQGLVIDPADHGVTHVLLQEGHFWGKKTVAIPIRAVTRVGGGSVRVQLSKAQVGDLPPVDLDHP